MKLVVGIDAGGSKTEGLVATAGEVVAEARALGANLQVHGVEGVKESLRQLLDKLDAAVAERCGAELSARNCAAICLGMAGADRESERVQVREILGQLGVTADPILVHDAEIALIAGLLVRGPEQLKRPVGIVVVSGTGAICHGIDGRGQRARSGGWGYLLADEGSAFWLGQQVVRRSLRAIDRRGPATSLTDGLARELALESPEKVIAWVYGQPSPQSRLPKLLPVLNSSVDQGDPVALEIVREAAQHLVAAAEAVMEQLDFAAIDISLPVVCAGGAFRGCPALLESFRQQLEVSTVATRHGLSTDVSLLTDSPAHGAIVLARQALLS